MTITAISNTNLSSNASLSSSGGSSSDSSAVQDFLNFMKESPAQRMVDEWLKAHNLTEKELTAMPAAKRDAIEKQMAQDIENAVKQRMEAQEAKTSAVLS